MVSFDSRGMVNKANLARGSQMPFMTKDLSENTMKRSRLRNKYFKNNNEAKRKLYVKQRNYCLSLLTLLSLGYFRPV